MNSQGLRFLLVEPQFVLRRTIVAVARDLAKLDFHEAIGIDRARSILDVHSCRGLVLDMQDVQSALALIRDLRLGKFATPHDVLIIPMAGQLNSDDARSLEGYGVTWVLRKPFKIGELLNALVR